MKLIVFLLALYSAGGIKTYCQDTTSKSGLDRLLSFPDKVFGVLEKKSRELETRLDRQTEKYLSQLQKQEARLRKKIARKDSALAAHLFAGVEDQYNRLKAAPQRLGPLQQFLPTPSDSLATALHFIKNHNLSNLSGNAQLGKALEQYKSLQGKLDRSEQIHKFLKDRQQLLKAQFQRLGMVKELKKYRQKVYYYQAQVQAYRRMWEDPSLLEAKLLGLLAKVPAFKEFYARNSLFGLTNAVPGSTGFSQGTPVALQGLQTRAMVNQLITDRFGSGNEVAWQLQQNLQAAQGQLSELKNKLGQYASGSYGNMEEGDLPDFKPNDQKTKSFRQRLEYSANLQSQKARYYFPVTSDLGLSLGYKVNNSIIIGLGAAYKIGWGRGWNSVRVTHQGVGLRSFVDVKMKGSLFVSGGYEMNYRSVIASIDVLKDYTSWQRSGLIGLSKQYKVSKKLKGEMKLLWDFLSYHQVPQAQAVVFRIGYSLK